jgi:hypothetical protein
VRSSPMGPPTTVGGVCVPDVSGIGRASSKIKLSPEARTPCAPQQSARDTPPRHSVSHHGRRQEGASRPRTSSQTPRPPRSARAKPPPRIFYPNDANWKVLRADPIDRLLSPDDEPSH